MRSMRSVGPLRHPEHRCDLSRAILTLLGSSPVDDWRHIALPCSAVSRETARANRNEHGCRTMWIGVGRTASVVQGSQRIAVPLLRDSHRDQVRRRMHGRGAGTADTEPDTAGGELSKAGFARTHPPGHPYPPLTCRAGDACSDPTESSPPHGPPRKQWWAPGEHDGTSGALLPLRRQWSAWGSGE